MNRGYRLLAVLVMLCCFLLPFGAAAERGIYRKNEI